jgi:hypothetical protein
MSRAYMRVLGSEEHDLEILPETNDDVWMVHVPGFGVLIAVKSDDHPNSTRAVLVQGQSHCTRSLRRIGVSHCAHPYQGRIECDMLHKPDRLCVVIEP